MKTIQLSEYGGPEVLKTIDTPSPSAGSGEVVVKQDAIGVNYIDVYHRTGAYPNALPLIPGMEGAGTVVEVGPGVKEVKAGDRVAYCMNMGAYREYAVVASWKLVVIPSSMDFRTGAAAMLQGLTADYLCHGAYYLKGGHTALVHAAAGGVGLILVQMAKQLGARVIGTVSTEAKAELARKAGADDVILYSKQDFEPEVKRLTENKGCDVVYDSVGVTTFMKSLSSLRPRGCLVSFGQSSGPVPPIDIGILSQKGSLFLTRPTLAHYIATRAELMERADRLLGAIAGGKIKICKEIEFPLSKAVDAHRALEGRKTTGKVLLIPEHSG